MFVRIQHSISSYSELKRILTMILQKRHACSLALLVFAIGVTEARGTAQQMYKATMDLPVQTRWGGVVLHPGRHEILLENVFDGVPVIQVSGQGDFARILAGPIDSKPVSGRSTLRLVNVGGEYAVNRFYAGLLGKSYGFMVPKGKRNNVEGAAESGTTLTVSDNP
jgi:hypothetical protein